MQTVMQDKRYFWHLWSKFKGKMIIRGMWVWCRMVQKYARRWQIGNFWKCIFNRLSRVVCIMIYSICFRMQNNMLWCFYLFANLIFFNLGRSNLEYKVVASTQYVRFQRQPKMGCCKSIFGYKPPWDNLYYILRI